MDKISLKNSAVSLKIIEQKEKKRLEKDLIWILLGNLIFWPNVKNSLRCTRYLWPDNIRFPARYSVPGEISISWP